MNTVFIVDDNNVNLLSAEEALEEDYQIYTMKSASSMFEVLEIIIPDLILLDVEMPEINGFQAFELLKSNAKYEGIPVIFLTSRIDAYTEAQVFEVGAADYIAKPFSRNVLIHRIKKQLDIEGLIRERTKELQRVKTSIVSTLANIVENRDELTGNHLESTSKYIGILLNAMLQQNVYTDVISEWDFNTVVSSARLHDVGKVTISDLLLNKPGKLTPEEFDKMKTHAIEGERIIERIIIESRDEALLHNAKLFAGCHHERWDGTGYPRGLKGDNIPLQGRIMAIVDVYDALVSNRPYKSAFSHQKAVDIISESKGTHFDPKLVDVFLKASDLFAEVNTCD